MSSFERTISGQVDPALVVTIEDTVRRICQADSVVFQLRQSPNIPRPLSDATSNSKTPLCWALSSFLTQEDLSSSSETCTYRDKKDQEFVFVRLPLICQGELVGKLALAFAGNNWDQTEMLPKCTDVSRLVSLLVQDYCLRADLEVDLIDMQRRVERMTRKAEIDPLTQVDNRSTFEKKARERLSAGVGATALLLLDIDHFKLVNDIYGHQFGDNYLRSIADALRNTFPRGTLIGRIGGDEFCAMIDLPSSTRSFLESLVKQLRGCLQRSAAVLGKPELGRVSIGISIHPMQAHDYHNLFSAADTALYSSKRSGRNTTTIYNGALQTFLNHRDFSDHFSQALEGNQIVAHFQPIVALETGGATGFEVLARWQEPMKGLIKPQAFEPVFHDYRMAGALTSRIVTHALECVSDLPGFVSADGPELWFNLTTFDLLNPEFVFDMQAALNRFGFEWERIVLEVTERVMLGESSGQVYRSLDEMRRRGARIAFDDFGTGHAGLLHVKDWPVDIIKIDRSFTGEIGKCERDQVVVEALLQIAATMGQDVVAEGIETESQLTALQQLGCRYGQGFLFSSALSAEELASAPMRYETCQAIPA